MLRKKLFAGLSIALAGTLCMTALVLAAAADTRVADAAMKGDINAVRTLLKQGADVNAAHGDGMSALHWAAYKDNLEMAQMLLVAGANLTSLTRINGMTPLFIAAQNGNPSMVDALLKAGADPNATLSTGTTPLMYAARAGNPDAVKLLLAAGANPNAWENYRGETALMFAAAANRPAAIKVLMAHGANPSISSRVIDIAARNAARGGRGGRGAPAPPPAAPATGPAPAVPTTGAPPATPPDAAPAAAAPAQGRGGRGQGQQGGGNMDESRPPRVDSMGGLTALLFAARQGHMDAVQALLESGADINGAGPGDKTTPLLIATINGHYDLARFLLEKGADPKLANSSGGTPLYTTINVKWAPLSDYPQPDAPRTQKTSYIELMKLLLAKGADPNARLSKGLWFTSYNFDLSRIETAGATAFWRAAQAADVPAMRMLAAAGADPKLKNNGGASPLHVAAGAGVHGNDEITATGSWMPGVRYLVDELKADVNELDGEGLTAVHHAASRGDNEMILFLVSRGARVDIVGKNGQTTADLANGPRQRIQPFPETIALLMALGSKNSNKCVSC